MPAERTLARPLSGEEVIEAIGAKIKEQLRRDCFLAPHMAYGSFSFTAKIEIKFQGSRIEGTQATVSGGEGVLTPDVPTTEVHSTASAEPQPPNEVRRETGQGVPVVTKGPSGRLEEKRVKYERQGKPKPAA